MTLPNLNNSILQPLASEHWKKRNLTILVKRDDLIHTEISGNKWRKLLYSIEEAKQRKNDSIITFGGAFSNHLVATACACQQQGIKTIGIVRGEELTPESNDTLKRCQQYGMQLVFVSRELYRLRHDYEWWKELQIDYPNSFIVPEGGANHYGVIGCQEIWKELPKSIDRIFVAQGTTTTSAGILLGAPDSCTVHAVPVLKGFDSWSEIKKVLAGLYLDTETINDLHSQLIVENDYHFGGYANYTPQLLNYIQTIYQEHQLPLDPIYTAKAFFAMEKTIQRLDIQNETIIFIHTGGLQGAKEIMSKENIHLY